MDPRILDAQAVWDTFGGADPLWAVLSAADKQGGRWKLDEFMRSGEREIALLMHRIQAMGLALPRRTALDFGCGVGRNTQAIGRRFGDVTGLDISPRMVALARQLNPYGHVHYRVNSSPDLRDVADRSIDLVYSNIVLQHVEPRLAAGYVREFLRVVAGDGLAVFQLPSHQPTDDEVAIRPMHDAAYSAHVAPLTAVPACMAAGQTISVQVEVTNTSPTDWQQSLAGSIRVGNQWYDATGVRMVIQDDGRTPLPQVLRAGESCAVPLDITAPPAAGAYTLLFDVVHEGVAWFAGRNSRTFRTNIEVTPAEVIKHVVEQPLQEFDIPDFAAAERHLPRPRDPESLPGFPMHGIPQRDVMDLIRSCGARLVHVEEDRRARPEWVGYVYYARVQ